MPVSVKDKIKAMMSRVYEPAPFCPDALRQNVALSEMKVESADGDQKSVARKELKQAKQAAESESIRVAFRHIAAGQVQDLRDQAAIRRRDYVTAKGRRQIMRAEVLDSISDVGDEDLIRVALQMRGFGPDYTDEGLFETPRDLLLQKVAALRDIEPHVLAYCSADVSVGLTEAINAVEYEADTAAYDDWLHGFAVHPTEIEEREIHSAPDESVSQAAESRDQIFRRHLQAELDRRRSEVAEARGEIEVLGREKLVETIVARAIELKADVIASDWLTKELIAAMAVEPAVGEDGKETGEYAPIFEDADEVDLLETAKPEFYAYLVAHMTRMAPSDVQEVVASGPFLANVVQGY